MPTPQRSRPTLSLSDKPLTDYSIWTLAYCQADMPYDFFGGSGLMSNQGTIQIPMLYTVLVGGEVGGKRHVALVDVGFGNQDRNTMVRGTNAQRHVRHHQGYGVLVFQR